MLGIDSLDIDTLICLSDTKNQLNYNSTINIQTHKTVKEYLN